MKVSGAVLSLVVIAAALCCQVRASPFGSGIPTICCLQFHNKRISPKLVVTYHITSSQCTQKGVVFITKRGFKVCANPKDQWVQHIMNQLDNQKVKIQESS
ncbi:C-C motif chemokine 3 [Sarcophilus harrisii]|uniref:C-C motif chemokine n=1 Tax=Sarcophilus harrisii TaxID=9305 RepID=G3WLV4_SARHA|nr:C-C motif chemokine 3 [Sarcophilus harrisii]